MSALQAIIGLEIHIQLGTATKLFCADRVTHDEPPNTHVCPVCLGLPGALPAPNERAVSLALRAAAMLGCTIHPRSVFVRKNYFYPDLPKGYQITQLEEPLATGGTLDVNGTAIAITRVHLEEDAAKLLHDRVAGCTAIDFNRCGIPLVEVVTAPEFRSADAAVEAARQIRQLMRFAGVSECSMERGSLRVDANVSLRQSTAAGARTEIKNINSFAHLKRAIDAEIARQTAIVDAGGVVSDETLAWDDASGELRLLRAKEDRARYRYMTEPDLPPLVLSETFIASAIAGLPELPRARAARFVSESGVDVSVAAVLTSAPDLAAFYEQLVVHGAPPRTAANWLVTATLAWCNREGRDIAEYPVAARDLARILRSLSDGEISRTVASEIVAMAERSGVDVSAHSRDAAGRHTTDATLESWIDDLLRDEADAVASWRAGNRNIFPYLMGRLMSRGRSDTDPKRAVELLRHRLET